MQPVMKNFMQQGQIMILYKYRSLDNLKFLIDIFLNNRLYAAPYTDMNDPMEGHYFNRSGELSAEFKSALKGEKDNYGICSLSSVSNNNLMWAHYANSHNGVAIGVEVDSSFEVRKVKYKGLGSLTHNYSDQPAEAAVSILSHKLEIWDYEQEYRVFVQNDRYVAIAIREVIFGRRVSEDDKEFYRSLFSRLSLGIDFKDELS
ncbi:hypothetical protein MUQ_04618 [Vibrio harveyi CAIM 1792]|nr:hypothetical protein MUQ_04618 [Vibrio harveyi CAIM 1792]